MARTRTYVAFDGDSDIMSYRTIQSWLVDSENSFNLLNAHEINTARDDSLPESIINQLRERLDRSKNMILLIGEKTKGNRKGILKYEVNYALRNSLPIFLVFIGFNTDTNNTEHLWNNYLFPKLPSYLVDAVEKYCLVCPFNRDVIGKALKSYDSNYLPTKGYTWYWK